MSWLAPWRQTPGERLRVANRDARVAERARVLVDPEREDRRLERRHLELALGQDRDHRRRQGAVLGAHDVLGLHPVELLLAMVVEEHDLDGRVARHALELAEPARVRGLDDDQAGDPVGFDPARLGDVELLSVQAVEVANVPVQRAGERDDGAGIEPARRQHGGECVEIGVRVRDDDVHATKVRPVPRQPLSWGR